MQPEDIRELDEEVPHLQMAAYDTEQEGDLFRAVFYNITDLLEETLSSGVRVNASDSHGRTPLHEAASCAHLACLDILLKYGGKKCTDW